MYRAIFFDLDDTLCDDVGASRRAVALACERLAAHYPHLAGAPLAEQYIQASTALWTTDPVKLAGPVRAMRLQAWRAALAALDADPALADAAVALYSAARRETYHLFPDSRALLRLLRVCCYVALLTNGPADLQREKIDAMGLRPECDDVIIAGEVGLSKPDPAIFHLALTRAGCQPSYALMVGNSWEKDILAARAVGMDALWIDADAAPDAYTVAHIRDVAGWLVSRRDAPAPLGH